MVIKCEDGSKVEIKREYIDESLSYIVNMPETVKNRLRRKYDFVIMLQNIILVDNTVTVRGYLVENMMLKEEYHVTDGALGKVIVSEPIHLEEEVNVKPVTFYLDLVKEITGDLEMIQDMTNEGKLESSLDDLIKYDIILKPKFHVIKGENNKESYEKKVANIKLLTKK